MLKLMRLEMAKHNGSKWVRNAVFCMFLPLLLVLPMGFAAGEDTMTGATFADVIRIMVGITFLIFASVMHSAFTVSEYKAKTIDLMFSYPIKRRKILAAKMAVVICFNFVAIIAASFVCYFAVSLTSRFATPFMPTGFEFGNAQFYINLLISAFSIACMSIIALYVGMLKKSTIATVVTSFFLMALLGTSLDSSGPSDIQTVILPLIFSAISIIIAFITISGVEKKDVL